MAHLIRLHALQVRHLQRMISKPWPVIGAFVAIMLLEVYSLFPTSERLIAPFPFSQQELTFQVWIDYAAKITAVCVLLWQLRNQTPEYYMELNVLLWLLVGYLIDYFLIYNEPIGHIDILGYQLFISYTFFMVILSGLIVFKSCRIL